MKFRNFIETNSELATAFKNKLSGVPQDPVHHPEGDVLTHTRLVRKAIPKAIRELEVAKSGQLSSVLINMNFGIDASEAAILAMATWLHDIGKATATTIGGNPWHLGGTGKIQALGHQYGQHFLPQIEQLSSVAPEATKELYTKNAELINWLIEHHMDFANGQGFSKSFVSENFDGGVVKPTQRMKLLLILMWADKMGRLPESSVAAAAQKNSKNLLISANRGAVKAANLAKQSVSFGGSPEEFAQSMKTKNMTRGQRMSALRGKYPQLTPEEITKLSESVAMQPTIMKAEIPMPNEVLVLDKALRQGDNSVVVYAVGGAVRDFLFNQFKGGGNFSPKDTDLTTNLSEEEILARLRTPFAQQLGIKVKEKESVDTFGVVFASVRGSETLEVAPFRKDVGSVDGRRPERVERAGIEEDAMRRDLTMNNLYYDFHKKQILDFNPNGQGIEDVRAGRARPVGDPHARFDEDKLRVLRLVRFFSRFNNGSAKEHLDEKTRAAIDHFKKLQSFGISNERIVKEFTDGIKQSLNTASFLQNYADLGLLDAVFPGMDVDVAGINRLGNAKNAKVILAWLLRRNANVGDSLNKMKYPREISQPVQFLIDCLKFSPDNAFAMVRRRDKNAVISEETKKDLQEFAAIIGDPSLASRLSHLSGYNMVAPSGEELMARGLKGAALGDEQRKAATAHYNQSFSDYMSQQGGMPDEQQKRI